MHSAQWTWGPWSGWSQSPKQHHPPHRKAAKKRGGDGDMQWQVWGTWRLAFCFPGQVWGRLWSGAAALFGLERQSRLREEVNSYQVIDSCVSVTLFLFERSALRGRKWRDFSEGAVVEWVAPSAQRGRCSSLWIYIDECRPSVLASTIELERS